MINDDIKNWLNYDVYIYFINGSYKYAVYHNSVFTKNIFDDISMVRHCIFVDTLRIIMDKIIELWDKNTWEEYEEYFVEDIEPYITTYKMIKKDIDSIINYIILGDDIEDDIIGDDNDK